MIWICFSDRLAHDIFINSDTFLVVSTYKGCVYVLVITALLYLLLHRAFRSVEAAERKLVESYRELTSAHGELEAANEKLEMTNSELSSSREELERQLERVNRYAYGDPVTGLPNRLWMEERVTQVIAEAPGNAVLLYIDLDNFRYINDSFGHTYGDMVLAETGKRLALFVDGKAVAARLGGDEFAVLLSNAGSSDYVKQYADELLAKLDTSFRAEEINVHITASIGITVYPYHGSSFEELLKNADTAMYKAKSQGKNRFALFDDTVRAEAYWKVEMESNLRAAVEKDEFVLHYQPLYCLETKKISSFEALIRWNSPIYGLVSPNKFIPLAEETGLILQIGRWVLEEACRFMSRLNSSRQDKLNISVNISMSQLAQENFVADVLEILGETGLDAANLELELTESVLMENTESKSRKVETLKKYGIRVALDDFGSGYSSLAYLRKLPISILKLDKAFIDDITTNKTDNDITRSVIMLAHILGLSVVAEGVEKKEQFDCLAEYGCDIIQGYYISRPVPEHDAENIGR